jgi:uncharacterized membrane protein
MSDILLIGESWIRNTTDVKGFDSITYSSYGVGTEWIERAVTSAGHRFHHLPAHLVDAQWPDLEKYDAVLLSDVGANTFLLTAQCWERATETINPLTQIVDYVSAGGGFAMIGGYLSFAGLENRAAYANTPIAEVLPVTIAAADDRVELPQGVEPTTAHPDHAALGGAQTFGPLLGYNRVVAREGGEVLLNVGADPVLVTWPYGKGRALAYASDCSEHWASRKYLDSSDYSRLWGGMVTWLINGKGN